MHSYPFHINVRGAPFLCSLDSGWGTFAKTEGFILKSSDLVSRKDNLRGRYFFDNAHEEQKKLIYLFHHAELFCWLNMTSPMKSLSAREDKDGARAIHSKVSKDKYKCVSNFYFTIKACVKFPPILKLARYNGWILDVHHTDNVSM